MADGQGGANNDQILQARRLQELFHGRFEQEESLRLLAHNDWNLTGAINFVFEEPQQVVRQVAGSGDGMKEMPRCFFESSLSRRWHVVTNGFVRELVLGDEIRDEIRQYACGECDNVWWRKIPVRKPVSRCKRCRRRFNPVPKDREWGWGRFQCECGNSFSGFATMAQNFLSPCYACHRMCRPLEILPPTRRQGGNRRRQHSCNAHNCYNRINDGGPAPTLCVHPRSLQHQVVYPSQIHISSGSTVGTFLDQGDLASIYGYPPSTIQEESGSDSG